MLCPSSTIWTPGFRPNCRRSRWRGSVTGNRGTPKERLHRAVAPERCRVTTTSVLRIVAAPLSSLSNAISSIDHVRDPFPSRVDRPESHKALGWDTKLLARVNLVWVRQHWLIGFKYLLWHSPYGLPPSSIRPRNVTFQATSVSEPRWKRRAGRTERPNRPTRLFSAPLRPCLDTAFPSPALVVVDLSALPVMRKQPRPAARAGR